MNISVADPITPALKRIKRVLFQPFDLGKWFGLGFCAWLAYLGSGGGSGSANWNLGGRRGGPTGLDPAVDWVNHNMGLVVLLVIVVLALGIGLTLLMAWLHSRGTFMFLDGVVHNRGNVKAPWRRFRELGNDLYQFLWKFYLAIFAATCVAALIGLALGWHSISGGTADGTALVAMLVCSLMLMAVVLTAAIVSAILNSFVVPAMYLHDLPLNQAWPLVQREIISGRIGTIILFFLMKIVLGLATSLAIMMAMLATCCMLAIPLIIPYIGTVLLLPIFVFHRSYDIYFLQQFGDRWRFIDEGWPPRCPNCQYNLHGNVSGYCPECGTPIPQPPPGAVADQPPTARPYPPPPQQPPQPPGDPGPPA